MLVKVKPTSAGRRAVVKVVNPELHKGEPFAPLLEKQIQNAGRNSKGHITTRHKGGGHKHHYRVIDFKRNKDGIEAKVERLEYDPNRSANIALLCYADGERRYIIAPNGVAVGAKLVSGSEAPIKAGNTLPIRNIPVGTTIHCIEMQPGKGAQMARSAGASVQLLARESSCPCPCPPLASIMRPKARQSSTVETSPPPPEAKAGAFDQRPPRASSCTASLPSAPPR